MSNEELAARIAKARMLKIGSAPINDIFSAPSDEITDAERDEILAALRPPAPSQDRVEAAAKAMWDSEPVIYSWGPQERHHVSWEDGVARDLAGVKIFRAFSRAALLAADQAAPALATVSQHDLDEALAEQRRNLGAMHDDTIAELNELRATARAEIARLTDALEAARLAGWEEAKNAAAQKAKELGEQWLAKASNDVEKLGPHAAVLIEDALRALKPGG